MKRNHSEYSAERVRDFKGLVGTFVQIPIHLREHFASDAMEIRADVKSFRQFYAVEVFDQALSLPDVKKVARQPPALRSMSLCSIARSILL
jgi:hypothetical protein